MKLKIICEGMIRLVVIICSKNIGLDSTFKI